MDLWDLWLLCFLDFFTLFHFFSLSLSLCPHFTIKWKGSSFHWGLTGFRIPSSHCKRLWEEQRRGNLILKKPDNLSFLYKWKSCSLYLSLPEVLHYTPTNSPISHGSPHVVDAFRIFSNSSDHSATSAVIGLLTSVQMFQTVLQVYSQSRATSKSALMCSKMVLRENFLIVMFSMTDCSLFCSLFVPDFPG